MPLKYFTDFCLKTALSTEFKAENVASVLVLPAVKKRKKTRRRFLPLDIKKRALKEPSDHSEARFLRCDAERRRLASAALHGDVSLIQQEKSAYRLRSSAPQAVFSSLA